MAGMGTVVWEGEAGAILRYPSQFQVRLVSVPHGSLKNSKGIYQKRHNTNKAILAQSILDLIGVLCLSSAFSLLLLGEKSGSTTNNGSKRSRRKRKHERALNHGEYLQRRHFLAVSFVC